MQRMAAKSTRTLKNLKQIGIHGYGQVCIQPYTYRFGDAIISLMKTRSSAFYLFSLYTRTTKYTLVYAYCYQSKGAALIIVITNALLIIQQRGLIHVYFSPTIVSDSRKIYSIQSRKQKYRESHGTERHQTKKTKKQKNKKKEEKIGAWEKKEKKEKNYIL